MPDAGRGRGFAGRRGTLLAVALALALALVPAGCGSSHPAGTNADPATVVPAAAPLYASVIIQPSGTLKTETTAASQKLLGSSEPYATVLGALLPHSGGGSQLNYERDIKPWLGEQAAAFAASISPTGAQALLDSLAEGISSGSLTNLGEGAEQTLLHTQGTQAALVLDTSDAAKARAYLAERAHAAGAHAASFRGVSYQVASDGLAEGMVGDFAVIGTETALRAVIETEQAGTSTALIHASGYAKLTAHAPTGALAHLYVRSAALPSLGGLLGSTEQAYLSLLPGASAIALDIDTIAASAGTGTTHTGTAGTSPIGASGLIPSPSNAQATAALPGNSWLAAGVGDVQATFAQPQTVSLLKRLAALAARVKLGTYSLEDVFVPLSSPGIDLPRDLLSWMGSAGVFAAGSGLSLQAGIVATSNDPTRSRAAVAKLAAAYRQAGAEVTSTTIPGAEVAVTMKITGFPVIVAIGAGNGRFAIGLGPASVQEALNPTTTLAGSQSYQAAASTLGGGLQPSVYIEFPTLVTLIETFGLNQTEGISAAFPYLKALTTLSAGGGQSLDEGITRARAVVGLQ